MGTFRYPIEIGDPQSLNFEQIDMLADTGASYTSIPGSLLRRLGVPLHEQANCILADGRRIERAIGQTWVRIDGKSVITLVVFGDEGTEPLLGAFGRPQVRSGPAEPETGPYTRPADVMSGCGEGQPMQAGRMSNGGPTMTGVARLTWTS